MSEISKLIEAVMSAPADRREAIMQAAVGAGLQKPKPKPITVSRAAEIGGVDPRTIGRYAQRGMLTTIRISPRRVRYDQNEVERLFTEGMDAMRRAG